VESGTELLHGRFEDVDAEGRLLLRLPDGTRRVVNAGDVSGVRAEE
jgi:biotin-(acetyl-CoA carboxylase) ligase